MIRSQPRVRESEVSQWISLGPQPHCLQYCTIDKEKMAVQFDPGNLIFVTNRCASSRSHWLIPLLLLMGSFASLGEFITCRLPTPLTTMILPHQVDAGDRGDEVKQAGSIAWSMNQEPVFESPEKIVWKFGLKIEAVGQARGITATFPVPLEWPEQSILQETKLHSANVDKLKLSSPTKESRMVSFNVNQLRPGETAEAYLFLEMEKRLIVAPPATESLRVPKPVGALQKPFLSPSPFIESRDRRIVEIANRLKDEKLNGWDQVEVIYRWVRDHLEYQFDEEIRSCLEALEAGKGDCEEMSSLFIAICRAMQIPARAVWIPDHTYPEFYLEDDRGNGYWFPCQIAGDYHFGSMPELRPVIHKGDRFRVSGKREMVRYLEPTLIERSGGGAVKVQWVTEPVPPESASRFPDDRNERN